MQRMSLAKTWAVEAKKTSRLSRFRYSERVLFVRSTGKYSCPLVAKMSRAAVPELERALHPDSCFPYRAEAQDTVVR